MDVKKRKTEIMQTCFEQGGFVKCFGEQAVKAQHRKKRDVEIMVKRRRMLDECRMVIAEYEKRIAAEKRR